MKYIYLLVLLISNFVVAHSPDEINYNIVVNEDKQQLVVHFTQLSAIHLIKKIKPELQLETVIRLGNYLIDFELYFNKTIQLHLDGEKITFKLINNDLHNHDATLIFKLIGAKNNCSSYKISVTSFIPIYKRIKNNVEIELNDIKAVCRLDKNKTNCSNSTIVSTNKMASQKLYYWSLILIVIIILSTVYVKRKIRS